jgi:type IX secretion system PorP/SprF family membrane protein
VKSRIYILLSLIFVKGVCCAQDPHYSQLFQSPMSINPAYTGVFNGQARFSTIFRNQWSSFGSPISTYIVGFDTKLFDQQIYHQNPLNIGLLFNSQKSLKGLLTSNTFMLNTAYHIPLNREGDQSLGIGLSGTYGKRNFNFSNLAAGTQFTSGGFDLSQPSGEIAFENMKPYFSIAAGMLYCNTNEEEGSFFELGAAVFHLNKPLETILYEGDSEIPMRLTAHIALQRYVAENLLLDGKIFYQSQAGVDYLMGGLSLSRLLSSENDDATLVGIGCWYRTNDSVCPQLFTEFRSLKFGFSYDIQVNDIRKNAIPASSLEFSLQYRFK